MGYLEILMKCQDEANWKKEWERNISKLHSLINDMKKSQRGHNEYYEKQ